MKEIIEKVAFPDFEKEEISDKDFLLLKDITGGLDNQPLTGNQNSRYVNNNEGNSEKIKNNQGKFSGDEKRLPKVIKSSNNKSFLNNSSKESTVIPSKLTTLQRKLLLKTGDTNLSATETNLHNISLLEKAECLKKNRETTHNSSDFSKETFRNGQESYNIHEFSSVNQIENKDHSKTLANNEGNIKQRDEKHLINSKFLKKFNEKEIKDENKRILKDKYHENIENVYNETIENVYNETIENVYNETIENEYNETIENEYNENIENEFNENIEIEYRKDETEENFIKNSEIINYNIESPLKNIIHSSEKKSLRENKEDLIKVYNNKDQKLKSGTYNQDFKGSILQSTNYSESESATSIRNKMSQSDLSDDPKEDPEVFFENPSKIGKKLADLQQSSQTDGLILEDPEEYARNTYSLFNVKDKVHAKILKEFPDVLKIPKRYQIKIFKIMHEHEKNKCEGMCKHLTRVQLLKYKCKGMPYPIKKKNIELHNE